MTTLHKGIERRGTATQNIVRLYPSHKAMIKKLARKLGISESEVMRQAIEAKFIKEA
jgi:predicted DNA-binding protein